jgi:N-acetylglucosaminyl-diphospho-decaprenol L-rhamnosyltransferase
MRRMTPSSRPRVDVCVVTWNTAELTATALRRLLDGDQGCEIRLLVRDNGSSDGTVETLSRVVPEAEIDAGTENLGFAAGVNRLLARSDAPSLFLLNSDAWPEPGAIGRLVETARRHPEAAAIAPRIERPDGTLEHSTYPFPSLRVASVMTFRRRGMPAEAADELLLEGAWAHDRPRSVEWAVGAALLIPREAIADVGGFDERFFLYVEDLEWCWRAQKRGWDIRFDPSAVVRHVGNASGSQNYGARRTAAYHLNTYRFFRREHGLLASLAYRALNFAGCTGEYLRAKRAGDVDTAAYWRPHIRAHLTPAVGADGPPRTGSHPRPAD